MKENQDVTTPSQRERSKSKRRAAIIQIARECFLKNGYEGTPMSLIAQKMGGSKGTLWSYFTSKEELFTAVLDAVAVDFRAFMGTALNTDKNIVDALTDFCETYIIRISAPEAVAIQRLVINQGARDSEVGQIFYDHGPAINHANVARFLRHKMDVGNIPQDDADEAAQMLLNLCTSGYHDHVLYGLKSQDDEIARKQAATVVKQFLRCYNGI